MNSLEARVCLAAGFTLRHEYFSSKEWVKQLPKSSYYLFEDGVQCRADEFWNYRGGAKFNQNWSVIHQFDVGFEFTLRHKPSIFSKEIEETPVSIVKLMQKSTLNEYVLSNGLSFPFYQIENKIKDGVFEYLRTPLSDNDLR